MKFESTKVVTAIMRVIWGMYFRRRYNLRQTENTRRKPNR